MPPAPRSALIALGGNLGCPAQAFAQALDRLNQHPHITVAATSSNHTSPPAETYIPQPDYTNAAAILTTTLSPHQLLQVLLDTEQALGRTRNPNTPNAPRTIDLDLLMIQDTILQSETLTLPHPRMHRRRFVLAPLAEIAPDAIHPTTNTTIRDLLAACPSPTTPEPVHTTP